ncbi:MAG: STAS/SEC14 domain-containing protein [Acidimicrobiia bacterium]|nr:MAG: STAS/SEC14 domain-containing protein [Acidimicrobiia bacterium]
MIKMMDNLPDNVIGFEAVGEVDAGDYKTTLDPAVDAALLSNDKLRLIYLLGDQFDGYTGGAMWEDTKLGIGNWGAWEKIALVTDKDWVDDALKFLGWMVPGEIKVYATADVEAAKRWASE